MQVGSMDSSSLQGLRWAREGQAASLGTAELEEGHSPGAAHFSYRHRTGFSLTN